MHLSQFEPPELRLSIEAPVESHETLPPEDSRNMKDRLANVGGPSFADLQMFPFHLHDSQRRTSDGEAESSTEG
jgi:hypothetical protein